MKRKIKELRRVLLAIEADQRTFDQIADPVGGYHAYLLSDGGFIGANMADFGVSHDRLIAGRLTNSGFDLLDTLRDEKRLEKAQAYLEENGFDRDFLALCLAKIRNDSD